MSLSNKKTDFSKANFHGMSVYDCAAPLSEFATPGFFTPSAITHVEQALIIAKAYRNTVGGQRYESANEGRSVDSPEWVEIVCNDIDLLGLVIDVLQLEYFEKPQLKNKSIESESGLRWAIDGCSEWIASSRLSPEVHEAKVASVNKLLDLYRLTTTSYSTVISKEQAGDEKFKSHRIYLPGK